MSDDGYADDGYSQYSDFEDLLYDADPTPDLADDLASHAVHSPIFADEPGYELSEYHSDWEYYSDDYYDDDPGLLKGNPQEGSPLKSLQPAKRGKKRKLADLDQIPDIDLGERAKLRDCIQGTVWAKPAALKDNIFRVGKSEKVALLSDWEVRFGSITVQPPNKSRRPNLLKDESWANNMSLADMGLLTERSSRMDRVGGANDAGEDDEEEEPEYENGVLDEEIESILTDTTSAHVGQEENTTPKLEVEYVDGVEGDPEMLPLHPHKKARRSQDILPSPPTSTESTSLGKDKPAIPPMIEASDVKAPERGRGRPPRRAERAQEADETNVEVRNTSNNGPEAESKNKKRKASASPPADPAANSSQGTRSIARGRGKRVASSSVSTKSAESRNGSVPKAAAAAKPARSKKR
jgi:hypothetical protein